MQGCQVDMEWKFSFVRFSSKLRFRTSTSHIILHCIWFPWTPFALTLNLVVGGRAVLGMKFTTSSKVGRLSHLSMSDCDRDRSPLFVTENHSWHDLSFVITGTWMIEEGVIPCLWRPMYRARVKGGPQVAGMLQAKPGRSGKQEQ